MTERCTYPEDTAVGNILFELVVVLDVGGGGDGVRIHLLSSKE